MKSTDQLKARNHFGLFLLLFCRRTNRTTKQLAEETNIPHTYIRNYIEIGIVPNTTQLLKLANGMCEIAKTSRNRLFIRLIDELEKDIEKAPFPPAKRELQCYSVF
tara:strand:- start:442 stop:759 length:318 start_codon:yes stop_codon:yes gene_type:complete